MHVCLHQHKSMKRIRKKPILFVVETSIEFVFTEDINAGEENVGEPAKYENDIYYQILINVVCEDACLTTNIEFCLTF